MAETEIPRKAPQERSSKPNDDFVCISDLFEEHTTIANAYTILFTQLYDVLRFCDTSELKKALFHQAHTPDGIRLEEHLKKEIKIAKSTSGIIDALDEYSNCNWIDTRLIEVLAISSKSPKAIKLIKGYQKVLFNKKLVDVLSTQQNVLQAKIDYITAVATKVGTEPRKITVGDLMDHRSIIEDVILNLARGMLNIQHVNEGCLKLNYLMPVYYSFNAYKMALCNRHKFYTIDLMHIEVGDHPLVYDPWYCDLEKNSVQQILSIHHKVSTEMCSVVLDNMPMEDIVKLFTIHKIFKDDDVELISFAASEHVKKQLLSKYLGHLKWAVWSMFGNILVNTKSFKHVGNQLMKVLADNLPYTASKCQYQAFRQDIDSKTFSTLHSPKTIKLGFLDDSILFNKFQDYDFNKLPVFINLLQNIKHINPSEVEREFHYLSGHVIELLSCCHPELLRKWCENLLASEIHNIKLLPPYSVFKLRKLKTSSAILKMMSMFWSWSNHSVLKCLAEFSDIAAALLEDFDSKLYLNSLITKYPIALPAPSMIPHNNDSFTVLTLKCNGKLPVTLQEVYDIQSMIIEKCEITQHALQLLAVQNNPLILQWMISKYIVHLINTNVRKYHKYFVSKEITEICIHPNMKHCIDNSVNEKPTLSDKDDKLHSTARTGNAAAMKEFIQSGIYIDVTDTLGRTPLYEASLQGHVNVVEVLITAGADVNCVNNAGYTPLHTALLRSHVEVVKVLVTAGANVNCVDNSGHTPLYEASRQGHDKIVEVLITAGADVNCVNNAGDTPLHRASVWGHVKFVEILIIAGADVNSVNKDNQTPLHTASQMDHDEVAGLLIKSGANVNAVDKWGETPVDITIACNHYKVADVILKSGVCIKIDNKIELEQICESANNGRQYRESKRLPSPLATHTSTSYSQSLMSSSKITDSRETTSNAKVGKSLPLPQSEEPFLDINITSQNKTELSGMFSEDPEETLSTHFLKKETPDTEGQQPSRKHCNVM